MIACNNVKHLLDMKSIKRIWDPNSGQRGQNCAQNYFFRFSSLVFFEIGYSDSLQKCIASTRGTNHEKKFW